MKAERRHELKTNSLSKGLENTPAFFQQHGSRILLALILCLLGYILVKNHIRDKADKAQRAAQDLGSALYYLNELRNLPTGSMQRPIPPEQLALLRKEAVRDVESAIAETQSNTDDPKILAQALVVQGDLNWELANFPALRGATTRPELGTDKAPDEYLTAAADAYNKVLQPPLNQDHASVIAARLSLANVAENRGQWDKAREYFQQVADDSAAGDKVQLLAKTSIEDLKSLEKPVFLGSETPQTPVKTQGKPVEFGPALPSGLSPSSAPASEPASAPSTRALTPIVPSTQPAIGVPSSSPSLVSPPTTRRSTP